MFIVVYNILYCIILYFIYIYITLYIFHCMHYILYIILYYIVLYCILLYYIVLYRIIPIILDHIISYYMHYIKYSLNMFMHHTLYIYHFICITTNILFIKYFMLYREYTIYMVMASFETVVNDGHVPVCVRVITYTVYDMIFVYMKWYFCIYISALLDDGY